MALTRDSKKQFANGHKEIPNFAKSLMRMFSPKGNPSAEELFTVIHHLKK